MTIGQLGSRLAARPPGLRERPERPRLPIIPMSSPFPPSPIPLVSSSRALALPAWLLALAFCAWVAAELFWQFAAPTAVAAVARHEPDARKVAARIGLHIGHTAAVADNDPGARRTPGVRYTVTGIATGFGALPGFVILQADDGSTLSLSPGQALPDGRRLVRLLPEVAEFELDGRHSRSPCPPAAVPPTIPSAQPRPSPRRAQTLSPMARPLPLALPS